MKVKWETELAWVLESMHMQESTSNIRLKALLQKYRLLNMLLAVFYTQKGTFILPLRNTLWSYRESPARWIIHSINLNCQQSPWQPGKENNGHLTADEQTIKIFYYFLTKVYGKTSKSWTVQKPFKITRKPSNPGLKKKPKGKTQNGDKNGKQNQDYNKVLKTQVECEELYFISDINIISWFRDMKLCLMDGAV